MTKEEFRTKKEIINSKISQLPIRLKAQVD